MHTALPALVLLPGLDGTGDNFAPLLGALGPGERGVAVRYPTDRELEPEGLDAHVRTCLPSGPFLLVAESFSGPVGIRLAASRPPGLVGLVLVATFRRFPWRAPAAPVRWLSSLASSAPPPRFVIRWWLTGRDADPAMVDAVQASIAANRAAVIAHRLRMLCQGDVESEVRALAVPTLYLRAAHDTLVPAHNATDLASLLPALSTTVVDAPHLLLQRAPDAALEAIRAWWAARGSG